MTAAKNDARKAATRERVPRKSLCPLILAFLLSEDRRPRSTAEIATHIDRPVARTAETLRDMLRKGALVRHARGVYAAAPGATVDKHRRPQPIRDRILDFLLSDGGRSRRAKEIADHIGRPVSTATGHLRSMKRLQQVMNPAYGVYKLPSKEPNDESTAKLTRTRLKDRLLDLLTEERTLREILEHEECVKDSIVYTLKVMLRHGTIVLVGEERYRRAAGRIEHEGSLGNGQPGTPAAAMNGSGEREPADEAA